MTCVPTLAGVVLEVSVLPFTVYRCKTCMLLFAVDEAVHERYDEEAVRGCPHCGLVADVERVGPGYTVYVEPRAGSGG